MDLVDVEVVVDDVRGVFTFRVIPQDAGSGAVKVDSRLSWRVEVNQWLRAGYRLFLTWQRKVDVRVIWAFDEARKAY